MDNFIYKYENILQLRIDEEDQCKNELGKRLKRLQSLRRELGVLSNKLKKSLKEFARITSGGCTVIELRELEAEKKWLKDAIVHQQVLIEAQEKEVLKAREILGEASKKRKIMEKLKENQYEEFLREVEAKEEQITDQIVTFRDSVKRNP